MATAYPAGIGNNQQASQATAAMRQEPWYSAMLKAWGLQNDTTGVNGGNPLDAQGRPAKLNDDQRQAIMEAAQHYGIGMNNKFDQIDENGQISEAHHKLKKLAIGAAIGGLALTGLGAAGIGPLAGTMSSVGGALGHAGSALAHAAGLSGAAGGTGSTGSLLSAITGATGTASKIAGLLDAGKDAANNVGSQSASLENQLANNRVIDAKVDQGGPAADTAAFRNAMRAGLVSKMDPNAAPLYIGTHAQTNLATPENVAYAKTLQANLAARQAAGKAPTEFGVPDPTQEELDARNRASTAATTGSMLDTGSTITKLFGLFNNKKSPYQVVGPNEPTTFVDNSDPSSNDGFGPS
jgi:hypothetical protein